jgi:excisionase family DNA binding protein
MDKYRPCTDFRVDTDNKKRLLTIREFSVRYGRSRSRTYELIAAGELPAVKDGRSTLIPVDAAEAWARGLPRISVPHGHTD